MQISAFIGLELGFLIQELAIEVEKQRRFSESFSALHWLHHVGILLALPWYYKYKIGDFFFGAFFLVRCLCRQSLCVCQWICCSMQLTQETGLQRILVYLFVYGAMLLYSAAHQQLSVSKAALPGHHGQLKLPKLNCTLEGASPSHMLCVCYRCRQARCRCSAAGFFELLACTGACWWRPIMHC